jgi:hypothetical protein
MWMFLSPVAYPLRLVPPEYRRVYALNPMAGIIDAFSSALLGQELHWDLLLISLSMAILLFFAGLRYFRAGAGMLPCARRSLPQPAARGGDWRGFRAGPGRRSISGPCATSISKSRMAT